MESKKATRYRNVGIRLFNDRISLEWADEKPSLKNGIEKKPPRLNILGMRLSLYLWYALVIEQPKSNVMIWSGVF